MCVCLQRNMFSPEILTQWEKTENTLVTDPGIKKPQLTKLLRMCGLSAQKLKVSRIRLVLASLKKHKLPLDPKTVADDLVQKYKLTIGGS